MTLMAFAVKGLGLPIVEAGFGGVLFGVSAGVPLCYELGGYSDTQLSNCSSKAPFSVEDLGPYAHDLANYFVEISLSGTHIFWGQDTFELRIFGSDGNVLREVTKLVDVVGGLFGGFRVTGHPRRLTGPWGQVAECMLGFQCRAWGS